MSTAPEDPSATVGRHRLSTRRTGQGPLIARPHRISTNGFAVTLFGLLGYGASEKPADADGFATIADREHSAPEEAPERPSKIIRTFVGQQVPAP